MLQLDLGLHACSAHFCNVCMQEHEAALRYFQRATLPGLRDAA